VLKHAEMKKLSLGTASLVHTQILSFAWFIGELKTARRSLMNNANSLAG